MRNILKILIQSSCKLVYYYYNMAQNSTLTYKWPFLLKSFLLHNIN